jgi:hypothetical protein
MAHPIYSVFAGDVLPIFFSTYDGGTGASITLTGLAVTDVEIYKDGSVTQRASDAGYTLLDTDGIDFDGITGIHGFSIDTGDNTDASFYTVGAWFTVVVSAVTIDAQTVNFIAAQFRIMAAESVAGKPKVDTDTFGGTAGTFASGRAEVNLSHIAGSAVSASTAQLGVNVVNFGGSAGTFASGVPAVNATQISGDSTAADNLETAFDDTAGSVPWTGIIDQGTAQSATGTTLVLRAAAAFANDELIGATILITGGSTGVGQTRVITDYVLASDTATVDTWTTTPSGTITYKIVNTASLPTGLPTPVNMTQILGTAVATPATAGLLDVNVKQISTDATAADNCELMFDGTGYAGGTAKLGVDVISISGDTTSADNLELATDGTGFGFTNCTMPTVTALTGKTGFSLDSAEHTNIADALLKRDMSAVSGEAARSPLNALRFIRNKWSISGTTLTVTKEDDSTSAWTGTITATAGADPITANDPA